MMRGIPVLILPRRGRWVWRSGRFLLWERICHKGQPTVWCCVRLRLRRWRNWAVTKLVLESGDVLIVRVDEPCTQFDLDEVRDAFGAVLPSGTEIIVMDKHVNLTVLRAATEGERESEG